MDKEQKAIERLKMASETSLTHYEQPLMITYSGGKDSDTVLRLALRAGIPMEVVHSHTTADAPETVRYVRRRLYELETQGIKVSVNYPTYKGRRESIWSLIPVLGAPTRKIRWCCRICKEQSGVHRAIATGVRWAESVNRQSRGPIEAIGKTKKDGIVLHNQSDIEQSALSDVVILNNDNDDRRRWMEHCQMRGEIAFNPIIDWEDNDVWTYLAGEEVNPLYSMGFDRVGCIGCPQAGKQRNRHFRIFPAYEQMWRRALERRLEYRKAQGKENIGYWSDIESYWAWWMEENPDQTMLDGYDSSNFGEG